MEQQDNIIKTPIDEFNTIIWSFQLIDITWKVKHKRVIAWFIKILHDTFNSLNEKEKKEVAWNYYRLLNQLTWNINLSNTLQEEVKSSISNLLWKNTFPRIESFNNTREFLENDDENWSSLRLNHFSDRVKQSNLNEGEKQKVWKMVLLKSKFNAFTLQRSDLKIILTFLDSLIQADRYKFEFTRILRWHPTFKWMNVAERDSLLAWFDKYDKSNFSWNWPDSTAIFTSKMWPLAAKWGK